MTCPLSENPLHFISIKLKTMLSNIERILYLRLVCGGKAEWRSLCFNMNFLIFTMKLSDFVSTGSDRSTAKLTNLMPPCNLPKLQKPCHSFVYAPDWMGQGHCSGILMNDTHLFTNSQFLKGSVCRNARAFNATLFIENDRQMRKCLQEHTSPLRLKYQGTQLRVRPCVETSSNKNRPAAECTSALLKSNIHFV